MFDPHMFSLMTSFTLPRVRHTRWNDSRCHVALNWTRPKRLDLRDARMRSRRHPEAQDRRLSHPPELRR
jgi:hypothetical protein